MADEKTGNTRRPRKAAFLLAQDPSGIDQVAAGRVQIILCLRSPAKIAHDFRRPDNDQRRHRWRAPASGHARSR